MYVEKVFDILFQLVKNGSENKSVVFIFLFSVVVPKGHTHGWGEKLAVIERREI